MNIPDDFDGETEYLSPLDTAELAFIEQETELLKIKTNLYKSLFAIIAEVRPLITLTIKKVTRELQR